jgi:two-component system sensor histidine kinase KdpD
MKQIKNITYPIFTSKTIQYLIVLLAIALTALLCRPLSNQQGYHIVSFILLFVVSILAVFLGIGPILLASTVSALVWNYLFIPPHYALHIERTEDKLMFGSFFVIALLNGVLTNRIRRQEKLALEREERTNAIFQLTRELSNTSGINEILGVVNKNVNKYFDAASIHFFKGDGEKIEFYNKQGIVRDLSADDFKVAEWVYKNSVKAGKFSASFPGKKLTYYPLTGKRLNPGVLAVDFKRPPGGEKEIFWDGYLAQISIAFEREMLSDLALKARILDESDKLYKTLFTLISHEFRIPIATIMGASDTLMMGQTSENHRTELFNEIFKASGRLNHLIENLLNMSRLESGKISVHLDWCDINDLSNKISQVLKQELEQFHVETLIPTEMPLVRLDFGLMEQVFYNIILNSCQNSPPGSSITFEAEYHEGHVIFNLGDNGPGFPHELLNKVFDKFFRVNSSRTGGLGLGLSIVKGLVEAHRGTVEVENRTESGARFIIKIPSEIPDMKIINLNNE